MSKKSPNLVSTGIPGLDSVLGGGLTQNRICLLEGSPGTGKTTLALQFLLEGVKDGEPVLFVTLSETIGELRAGAESHGMDVDGIRILELFGSEEDLNPENQMSMYQPWEAELGQTIGSMLALIDELKPTRIVIDSLSELRLQTQSAWRFRRQILSLKQYFIGRNCTVLLLDDLSIEANDMQLQSIAHGVLILEQLTPEFGSDRRRLRVSKLRGQSYRGGFHDFVIEHGGLIVFPRLIAAEHQVVNPNIAGVLSSHIAELDMLLGGGLEFGASTLLTGPAGSGKSTLSFHYIRAALNRGESAVIFTFDERRESVLSRANSMGFDFSSAIASQRLTIQQIDPAELSPGEFCSLVRLAVEERNVRIVVIDSLNGYLISMPEERYLIIQMHELLTYLGHRGVIGFLIVAQHGLLGTAMQSPVDATYLADVVVVLRYFEVDGMIKRAISVIKKRGSSHEKTIREFSIDEHGVRIGQPLTAFRGVLTGVPQFDGSTNQLLKNRNDE